MENGPNNNKETSDAGSMDDTEHRILMAYASRRRPREEVKGQTQPGPVALNGSTDTNPTSPPKTEKNMTQEVKRKKKKKKVPFFLRCIKPKTEEKELEVSAAANRVDIHDRAFVRCDDSVEDEDGINEVAAQAMGIADRIKFVKPSLETDSPDDVEKAVALLLRETGDELNDRFKKANISLDLFLNYDFFSSVVSKFLEMAGFRNPSPDDLGPQDSPTTQIAVTCEVTSRLSVFDTLPKNRLLDHGARFLKEKYSPWVQKQGGYEAVFHSQEELD